MAGNRLNYQAAPVAGVHTCLVDPADCPDGGVISLLHVPEGWTCKVLEYRPHFHLFLVKFELIAPPSVTVEIGVEGEQ